MADRPAAIATGAQMASCARRSAGPAPSDATTSPTARSSLRQTRTEHHCVRGARCRSTSFSARQIDRFSTPSRNVLRLRIAVDWRVTKKSLTRNFCGRSWGEPRLRGGGPKRGFHPRSRFTPIPKQNASHDPPACGGQARKRRGARGLRTGPSPFFLANSSSHVDKRAGTD